MLISCPQCETSYAIAAASIGEGRYVRCVRCKYLWMIKLEYKADPSPKATHATPHHEVVEEQVGKFARNIFVQVRRLAFLGLFGVILLGTFYFQSQILRKYPQLTIYYRQLRLLSTQGIMLENIQLQDLTPAGTQNTEIWIKGSIINHDNVQRDLPNLRVTLMSNGQALASENVDLETPFLEAGATYPLDHKLLFTGKNVDGVELSIGNLIELFQRRHFFPLNK